MAIDQPAMRYHATAGYLKEIQAAWNFSWLKALQNQLHKLFSALRDAQNARIYSAFCAPYALKRDRSIGLAKPS